MTIHTKVADLLNQRQKAFEDLEAVALADNTSQEEYDAKKKAVEDLDQRIKRARDAQALAASTAQPVEGQQKAVPASPENDSYVKDKTLLLGGIAKMMGMGTGNLDLALKASERAYGESHPVTKALQVSTGSAGGFIVPPDVMNEVIPLLRAQSVVRAAGPRNIPMPRGTMTLPGQASAASASYGSETRTITKSEQKFNQIVASYKKLTALVPVSNDMMRYADPAVDAFVRDDLVKVMGLREDAAFLFGDGTQDTPRGYLSFANSFGTTQGIFSSAANSTPAAGGNWITSTSSYTLATVAAELGGAVNKLDTANVPNTKRVWFMHPRSYNYLFNVQNSLGSYVYRDELMRGSLLTSPVMRSTQFPINIWNVDGSQKDCSFVMLVEMTEDIILDSMQLELSVFREGSYIDETGATISAMANDQTVIRAIAEHDHQMRHDAAVAVIQFVRWAPAIS
ncbi:phage major capsid protein [Rhizobium oryzicola]|uniref:Phage major capsid protein n=1 Tax=Rhizobium oryzicola TaxID=1232668 RepID=A0ABT8SVF6_9HYPH|nr:phage major capsid protein [Rhizobium oryzicola]MDO1582422.1 phage major capsid protein [Rhizobium oryzicola]